ncbi:MAG: excinuclease ABC subunit UvrA, partial [Muribaculaceae bacterium]|nr:excinuclease ABC subunit UvrA [Muribaculaceae bacterium]
WFRDVYNCQVYQCAVQCLRGEKMVEYLQKLIHLAPGLSFPIHKPYVDLTAEEKDILWHGKGRWDGIDGFFRWIDENQYKIQYRVMKSRYRGKTECPVCHGSRLRPDVEYVKIGGKTITQLVRMSVSELKIFFDELKLTKEEELIAQRLLLEIRNRIGFLEEVGLGYLTLDRVSNSLSGGESQRINLATSLGSSLVGSLYILDEPSIGLHSRDTHRLITVLRNLQEIGNTVVVVEHDEEIMLASDNIIDVGKDAGSLGGEIVFSGNIREAIEGNVEAGKSYTLDYLRGNRTIPYSPLRRPWKKYIKVEGAQANNLKSIDVEFPLGVMTVVTGVSGSGKSTLVREILYKGLVRALGEPGDAPATHKRLSGDIKDIGAVEFIDQNPIGSSSRSNPATYLKAFDEIRKLFSEQQLARQMGFSPSFFSFNSDGGRCDECKGEGTVRIPMQFMADIEIPCEVCHGKRYKDEVLEVKYRGRNIFDFLEMTIDDAISFLSDDNNSQAMRIIKKLKPLQDVGLGYVKLGQSSSTLSGGENQRVKLAYYLSMDNQPHTVFIFDEPTTGLHFHDIQTLMKSMNRLIDRGHTVIIIEHNMDVIKCADWVIDVGPEGGEGGGEIVTTGTPETIASCQNSYTGKYLKSKLQ